jgi:hypothetical protein
MHFLYSIYYELTAFTFYRIYYLIIRRYRISNWYIWCVLYRLAVTTSTLVAASRNTAHKIYQFFCAAPPEDEQVALETCTVC